MIYATSIRMKPSYHSTSSYHSLDDQLMEIDEIFLTAANWSGWYKKRVVHDYLKEGNEVLVNIASYPKLIAAVSINQEKYVRSSPNDSKHDNLLNLPRG